MRRSVTGSKSGRASLSITYIIERLFERVKIGILLTAILPTLCGCGSSGSAHKAVADTAAAASFAGGFNGADARLYKAGIQHIANQHQRPGQFTIAQVIDQERDREQRRNAAVADAREAAADHRAAATFHDSLQSINDLLGQKLFARSGVGGSTCEAIVDGDIYEYLSQQDREITWKSVRVSCIEAYRHAHGRAAEDGVIVKLENIADQTLREEVGAHD